MIVENTNPINFGSDSGDRSFLQSYYFVIVTLFTVGYGDISPKTPYGMMLMILFCLVYIGYRLSTQLTLLINLLNSKSIYARAKYRPNADAKHIVIAGNVKRATIETVVLEYFAEDHNTMSNQGRKAVIF